MKAGLAPNSTVKESLTSERGAVSHVQPPADQLVTILNAAKAGNHCKSTSLHSLPPYMFPQTKLIFTFAVTF